MWLKMTIEDIREYKKNAVEILKKHDQYATAKAVEEAFVSLVCLGQYMWERDVAISQLEELGLSLGQKTDDVQQAINFKKYFDELYGEGLEVVNWHLNGDLEPFDNFYENALQKQ